MKKKLSCFTGENDLFDENGFPLAWKCENCFKTTDDATPHFCVIKTKIGRMEIPVICEGCAKSLSPFEQIPIYHKWWKVRRDSPYRDQTQTFYPTWQLLYHILAHEHNESLDK